MQEGSTFAAAPVDPNRAILDEAEGGYTADGEIISSQTVSSKTRTVETITVSGGHSWPREVVNKKIMITN